jgi:hypothetical protein
MTTAIDHPSLQQGDQAENCKAGELPDMTPETAQQLAAMLAPHLLAMRAVTAGTRYEASAGVESAAGVSPATKIFIAGMLQRLPAATP